VIEVPSEQLIEQRRKSDVTADTKATREPADVRGDPAGWIEAWIPSTPSLADWSGT